MHVDQMVLLNTATFPLKSCYLVPESTPLKMESAGFQVSSKRSKKSLRVKKGLSHHPAFINSCKPHTE
jgi:hypothetical protein